MKAIIVILSLLCLSNAAQAHNRHHHRHRPSTGLILPGWPGLGAGWALQMPGKAYTLEQGRPGVVRARSGALAKVASSAVGAFQCVIDALEHEGYPVKFMGGLSAGHMRNSLHHVGLALDINQYARNVTKPHMPSNEISLAHSCGLTSGAEWRHGDSGHFQVGGSHYAGRRHNHRRARR